MCRQGLLATTALTILLTVSPGRAQMSAVADDVPVYLNGELLLRFRTASPGYSSSQRAELFEQRLRAAFMAPPIDRGTLRVHNDYGRPTLVLNGHRLVTVTQDDAEANGANSWTLAHAWRDHLDRAVVQYNAMSEADRMVAIERTGPPTTRLVTLGSAEPLPSQGQAEPLAAPTGATDVILNGTLILRFRSSAGGFSAHERYVIFQRTLQAALDHEVERRDVRVRQRNGEPALFLDGQYLCTVTGADAIANATSAQTLAHQWANKLRTAVAGIDRH